jgi:hypothetical protein
MRLSRLATDSSLPRDYQGFRGRVRVGPIDPRGGSAEQLPAHQPIGVVRRPFNEPPLTAESGGATRATLLAMRAHRGTGSSNPLPSSGESSANHHAALEKRDTRAPLQRKTDDRQRDGYRQSARAGVRAAR